MRGFQHDFDFKLIYDEISKIQTFQGMIYYARAGTLFTFTKGMKITSIPQRDTFESPVTFEGGYFLASIWYRNNRKITKTIGKIPKSTNPNLTLRRKLTQTLTQTLTLNLTPFLTLTLTLTNWLRPLIVSFSCIWSCSVDFGTRSTVLVGQYICAILFSQVEWRQMECKWNVFSLFWNHFRMISNKNHSQMIYHSNDLPKKSFENHS